MAKDEERAARREEPIFALDIGTHDVIGIVGKFDGELFHVLQTIKMEYPRRAMRDGQIEDIEQVAAVAEKVRVKIERQLDLTLRGVHLAAAGRSLKTRRVSYEAPSDPSRPIDGQQVIDLESCAIQLAEEELLAQVENESEAELYYIGHSVIRYQLDDYPIATLVGHRGKKIRVEAIATFLPGEVVESLYAVANRIGLSVSSVTLEPIAAMNAIIPSDLRLLNLALVDIGAGTSDIAISDGGSVSAYTMATVAGDEISEAIVREYLVDFETAERMKLELSDGAERISYRDILGFEHEVGMQELRERLLPALENLCGEICSRILEINGKPPAAVFLVGGGSKTVSLCGMIAKGLSLEENRVAVGGSNYIRKTVVSDIDVSGPEFATPMGIALTAASGLSSSRSTVLLNGQRVGLLPRGKITVLELLRLNGFERAQLLGRSGKSVAFEIDGRSRVARGSRQTAAVITVNGQPASLTTEVRPNDQVEVTPAASGEDACITVGEVVPDCRGFPITVNGREMQAGLTVLLNGEAVLADRPIADKDVLQTRELLTVEDLCRELAIDPSRWSFWKNGAPAGPQAPLCEGDELRYRPVTEEETARGEPVTPGKTLHVRLNGVERTLPPKKDGIPYQFVELLNFVEIDPTKPQGDLLLTLNGTPASYLAELQDGDAAEIGWKK